MNWKGVSVLVTGGTGFVGSHLVEALIDAGAVVTTTTLSYHPHSYFSRQQLEKKCQVIQLDICDYDSLFDLIIRNQTQYIFHLAAQAIVETAFYNPRRTFDSNVMGTVNVLEAARLSHYIKGVIIASSDKAYGKTTKKKYIENDRLQGDHPYEVSKSAADLISQSYYATYQLPVVVTRFGNIYGEGDLNFSRIIPSMCASVAKNTTLVLRSDGSFIRDYLYVKDVVQGYLLIAEKIKICKGEAFNFGSAETLSVLELIRLAEKILAKTINYTVQNTAKNEIPYQSLNFSKAKKILHWKPKFSLKNTLPDILEYYKNIV